MNLNYFVMGQSADFICLPQIKHARGRFPSRIHGTIQNSRRLFPL